MAVNSLSVNELTGRELPYNLEAEQTVLGALLLNPETLPTAIAHLKPESFYREQHREIYSIILRMFSNGATADIITVMNEAVATVDKNGCITALSQGVTVVRATVGNRIVECVLTVKQSWTDRY